MNSLEPKTCTPRTPDISPSKLRDSILDSSTASSGNRDVISLPKIKVPEMYPVISTPISTPNIDHPATGGSNASAPTTLNNSSGTTQFASTSNYKWGGGRSNTRSPGTSNQMVFPVTPMLTPQTSSQTNWGVLEDDRQPLSPPATSLPPLKGITENAPASSTHLPPLSYVSNAQSSPSFSQQQQLPQQQQQQQQPQILSRPHPSHPQQQQQPPQYPQQQVPYSQPPHPYYVQQQAEMGQYQPPQTIRQQYPQYPPFSQPQFYPPPQPQQIGLAPPPNRVHVSTPMASNGMPLPPHIHGMPQNHPPPPNMYAQHPHAQYPGHSHPSQVHGYYPGYGPKHHEMMPSQYQTQMLELASSREIKRRTKTGCLTCRKRRIKCDERHPTCFNCDKSKRVCLGYDPIFKVTQDRRRRKKEDETTTEDNKDDTDWGSGVVPDSPNPIVKMEDPSYGAPMDSTMTTSNTTTNTITTRTSSMSNGTDRTSPMSNHIVPYSDSRNKMNISSLLDAAAVIDGDKGRIKKEKRKLEDTLDGDSDSASSCSTIKKQCEDKSQSAMEDYRCDTWDRVEQNFMEHIAVFLDELIGTTRFTGMPIIGKAKSSGLPLDGHGTVIIPGGSNGERGSGSSKGSSGEGSNSTVIVGQSIATLEAIRQMLSILCPNFYLDNLSIDEGSVGKLEELRISNDFRLLRAVVQLISSTKDTQFLSVGDKDMELMRRIQALHTFIGASTADPHPNQDNHQPFHTPESELKTVEEIGSIFQQELNKADSEQIWAILVFIAGNRGSGGSESRLTARQEELFVEFASTCGIQHGLRVPILLGAHYYLLTRRPQRQIIAGRDSNLRLLLLETCSTKVNNVVTRRLINMILN